MSTRVDKYVHLDLDAPDTEELERVKHRLEQLFDDDPVSVASPDGMDVEYSDEEEQVVSLPPPLKPTTLTVGLSIEHLLVDHPYWKKLVHAVFGTGYYYKYDPNTTDSLFEKQKPWTCMVLDSLGGKWPERPSCKYTSTFLKVQASLTLEKEIEKNHAKTEDGFHWQLCMFLIQYFFDNCSEKYKLDTNKTRTHYSNYRTKVYGSQGPLDMTEAWYLKDDPRTSNNDVDIYDSYESFLDCLAHLEFLSRRINSNPHLLYMYRSFCFGEVVRSVPRPCRFWLDVDGKDDPITRQAYLDSGDNPFAEVCTRLTDIVSEVCGMLGILDNSRHAISLRPSSMGAHIVFQDLAFEFSSRSSVEGATAFVGLFNAVLSQTPLLNVLYSKGVDWKCTDNGTLSSCHFFSGKEWREKNITPSGNKLLQMKEWESPFALQSYPRGDRHMSLDAMKEEYRQHSILNFNPVNDYAFYLSQLKAKAPVDIWEKGIEFFNGTTQETGKSAIRRKTRQAGVATQIRQLTTVAKKKGDNKFSLLKSDGAKSVPFPSEIMKQVMKAKDDDPQLTDESAIVVVLNRYFRVIVCSSPPMVCYRIKDPNGQLVYNFVKKPEFKSQFENLLFKIEGPRGGEIEMSFMKTWMKNIDCASYMNVTFDPTEQINTTKYLNLWTGYKWSTECLQECYHNVMACPDKASVLNDMNHHLFAIMCSSSRNKFIWLWCFLTMKLRHPEFHPPCVLSFCGPEGTGKSMTLNALLTFFGRHGISLGHINQLFPERFNGYLKDKVFIHLEEASLKFNRKYDDQLKSHSTAKTCRYEEKGKESFVLPLHSTIILTTNDEGGGMVLGTSGARRWVIFQVFRDICRMQRSLHAKRYAKLHRAYDECYEILKAWLYQFFDTRICTEEMLKKFDTFESSTFPEECLKFTKDNIYHTGANYIAKFHATCLKQGYYYLPAQEPTLNIPPPYTTDILDRHAAGIVNELPAGATKPTMQQWIDWTLESNIRNGAGMFKEGEVVTVFARNSDNIAEGGDEITPYMYNKGYLTKEDVPISWHYWMQHHPSYKKGEEDYWLRSYCMGGLYNAFREFFKEQGFKGREPTAAEFRLETERSFMLTTEKFHTEKINPVWQQLSKIRSQCKSQLDWNTNKYHALFLSDTSQPKFSNLLYVDMGTLDEARTVFYQTTGMETDPDEKNYKCDLKSAPSEVYTHPDITAMFSKIIKNVDHNPYKEFMEPTAAEMDAMNVEDSQDYSVNVIQAGTL